MDRETGQNVWILGEHKGWPPRLQTMLLTPGSEVSRCYLQHMPQTTSKGTLLLFHYRTFSTRPFAPPLRPAQTRTLAVEYALDEEARPEKRLLSSQGQSGTV